MIRTRSAKLSPLSIALALGVAVGALSAAPVAAQKKGKEAAAPAAPKIKYSKEYQAAADAVVKTWTADKARPEVVAAKAKLDAAETALVNARGKSATAAAQKDFDAAQAELSGLLQASLTAQAGLGAKATVKDDKYHMGILGYEMGNFTKQNKLQRDSLSQQLDSGFIPAEKVPVYNFTIGRLAYFAKDYNGARPFLAAATAAGYTKDNADQLLAETYFAQNDAAGGMAVLKAANERARAAGTALPVMALNRAVGVANNALLPDGAGYFGAELVKAQPGTDSWQTVLYALRRAGRYEKTTLIDLLRLMHRTNSWAAGSDYIEFIQIGNNLALPTEVIAVADAGIASGKLNAADPSVRDGKTTATSRKATDAAQNLLAGYERDAAKPGANGAVITGAGDSFLSYGQPAKAAAFYTTALTKPGVDTAEVLTRLGIAQTDLGQYAEAQATFAKVTGPRAPLAQLWAAYAAQKAKGG